MPDLQELVRTVMALTPTGTTRLFYVNVSEAERLLKRVKELEAACTEAAATLLKVIERYDGELTGAARGDVDNVRLDLLKVADGKDGR